MKQIERLLQRVKQMPRPEVWGCVHPENGKWRCTLNKVIGNVWRGGRVESETRLFHTKGASMVMGRAHVTKGAVLLHVAMVDMNKQEIRERLGKARGKGYKLKGGGVGDRYETEKAVYTITGARCKL